MIRVFLSSFVPDDKPVAPFPQFVKRNDFRETLDDPFLMIQNLIHGWWQENPDFDLQLRMGWDSDGVHESVSITKIVPARSSMAVPASFSGYGWTGS
jgi:hypothetical protein